MNNGYAKSERKVIDIKTNSKNKLIKLLSICGQIAEHQSEKMRENNVDEARLLAVINEDEQKTLEEILTKLQTKWIEKHKERMKEHNKAQP